MLQIQVSKYKSKEMRGDGYILALSRENLSSGFLTKQVSNKSLQLQRLARK